MGDSSYTPTEAKYKGTAREQYITYDLEQTTRGEKTAVYPKVKRVYIAGDVQNWEVGRFEKKSGRTVHGVRIHYEQRREGYRRKAYTAERNGTTYRVPATTVEPSVSRYSKVIEIPEDAENVKFRDKKLPAKYQSALQDVR
ncbi:MAG: hypothetical protein DWQ34_24105 [Planctomycetota bacterium]|nr:MAG: hypothetical protein DWQ29_12965 [Planctomycetota bacterium]REJ87732.1 MAG: hypothetical protein DWQ34_24105 [Planctomycetota bacterium]REK27815.1 MAG: hypothetical protein DWQ41_06855 [Planctomycetota bacterium]REK40269.1 MAG: hypothetical protein DWQ45_00095 [Planctomycetota bacterium]